MTDKEKILLQVKKDAFEIFKSHMWQLKVLTSKTYPLATNEEQWTEAIKLSAGFAIRHHELLSEIIGKEEDMLLDKREDAAQGREELRLSVDSLLNELGFKVGGEDGTTA